MKQTTSSQGPEVSPFEQDEHLIGAESLFSKAQEFLRNRDFMQATTLIPAIMEQKFQEPWPYLTLASNFSKAGLFDAAERLTEKCIECFPNQPEGLIAYAWTAMDRKNYPLAIERWSAVRRVCPNSPNVYAWSLQALQKAGQLDDAEILAAQSVERFPTDCEVLIAYAWVATGRAQYDEACTRWAQARDVCSERLDVTLWYAQALRLAGQLDNAELVVSQASANFPANGAIVIEQARIAIHRKEWDRAKTCLEIARGLLHPGDIANEDALRRIEQQILSHEEQIIVAPKVSEVHQQAPLFEDFIPESLLRLADPGKSALQILQSVRERFHPAYYITLQPDRAGLSDLSDLLTDFLQRTINEDLIPDPFFDPRHAARLYQAPMGNIERWLTYLATDASTPRDPFPRKVSVDRFLKYHPTYLPLAAILSQLFDEEFYLHQLESRSIVINPEDALLHYFSSDIGREFDPHPLFDSAYYWERYPDIAIANLNPLLHYIEHGAYEGRVPHPLFTEYELDVSATSTAIPLYEYLREPVSSRRTLTRLFDAPFYKSLYPDVEWDYEDPLLHYLKFGASADKPPHRLFDVAYYRRLHYRLKQTSARSLLTDFVMRTEPRPAPFAMFDAAAYRELYRDMRDESTCAVTHFMLWGNHEWRVPNAVRSTEYIYNTLFKMAFNDRSAYDEYIAQGLNRRIRILFVGHEASRTGAPGILLKLIQHFARFDDVECICIIDQAGPLLKEFEKCSHVCIPKHNRIRVWTDQSKFDELKQEIGHILKRFEDNLPVLVICNSAETQLYTIILHDFGFPVISLVHEIADFYLPEAIHKLVEASDRVVLPSKFVADAMMRVCPLMPDQGRVLSQGLLRDTYGDLAKAGRDRVFSGLAIEPDDFVVAGCGTIDGRKGFDLFVETARRVRDRYRGSRSIKFVWIGGGPKWRKQDGAQFDTIGYWASWELERSKLGDTVFIISEVKDTEPYLIHSDVFLLTSRADPFPCVVHEAMASRLPVLCFENTGGAPEALGEDAGIVVPYLDVDAMSEKVIELAEDEPRRIAMGEAGRARVRSYYDFTSYAVRIGMLADEVLGKKEPLFGRVVPLTSNRGRVYFVAPAWNLSGVNTFTEELVDYLNKNGFDAQVLFTQGRDITRRAADFKSVPVPAVPFRFIQPDPDLWDPFSTDPDAAYRAAVGAFLTDNAPCILFPNYDYVVSEIAPTLPSSVGIIGIAHADDREHYAHCYKLGPYWNKIVGVSSEICEKIVRQNPAFLDKTCMITYGIAPPERSSLDLHLSKKIDDGSPLRMVFAGRLEIFQKRIYDYAELARHLAAAGVSFELSLVGDGPEREKLTRMLSPFIGRGMVKFPGRVSRQEVRELMLDAHVVLILSDFEGMPLSMIEGMHCGCIPVVYDMRSGIPEVIRDAQNGFIVKKGDFAQIVNICRSLQQERGLREKLCKAAIETVLEMNLTPEATGQKYVKLIDEVFEAIHSRSYVRPAPLTI